MHRIAFCRQQDVVTRGSEMELTREQIVWTWARIRSYYGLSSYVSQQGFTVLDAKDKATHSITVRYGLDLSYTTMAWVYEQRRKSEPRWYKILGFAETQNWVTLNVHLVEKSFVANKPQTTLAPQPSQVEL